MFLFLFFEEEEKWSLVKYTPLFLGETKEEDTDSDSDSSSADEGDYIGGGKGAALPAQKKRKRASLSPEELALGEQLVYSKKSKRDIMDAGWNR